MNQTPKVPSDDELPPLPLPSFWVQGEYTANQMRAYARAALALPTAQEARPSAERVMSLIDDYADHFAGSTANERTSPCVADVIVLKSMKDRIRAALAATPQPTEGAEPVETLKSLQAKIDALMLEYCPDEMTPEQHAEWARHQKPVAPEVEAMVNAALSAQPAAKPARCEPCAGEGETFYERPCSYCLGSGLAQPPEAAVEPQQ